MTAIIILQLQINSLKKARDRCMKEHTRARNLQIKEALQHACEALTFSEFKLEAELESLLTTTDTDGQNSN